MLNKEKKYLRLAQIEKDNEEKKEMSDQVYQLKKQVEALKDDLKAAELEYLESTKNRDILANIYDKNVIDQEGNPI